MPPALSGGVLMRPLATAILLWASVAYGTAVDGDWPSFRGDSQLTGMAPAFPPGRLRLAWTLDTAMTVAPDSARGIDAGIESTAAVVAGKVYVGTLDGRFLAVDLTDGELLWTFDVGAEVKSSPAVGGGQVFFGDEDGTFHALDAQTGTENWTFAAAAAITSSANLAGDRVVFGSYDNRLYCLSATEGSLLWKVQTKGYIHASPALFDAAVVTAGCDGKLRLVDLIDGGELTTIDLGSYVAASCAVSEGHAYVGTFAEEVVSIDLAGGEVVWRYRHPERTFPFYASAAVAEDLIIVGGRDKMLHAIDRHTGEARWVFAAGARIDSSPVIAGQRVFFASARGRIHAIDRDTGDETWSFDTGSSIAASPAVANTRLVIGDLDGTLYCFAGGTD
mgnify:CR=1 FL=1